MVKVSPVDRKRIGGSVVAGLASVVLMAAPVQAQRGGAEDWVLLGTHEVDRSRRDARIDLRGARGQVKAVRLVAKREGVELNRVSVTYADGSTHDEQRAINMNPNDRTRAIDQRPSDRFVDEVTLVVQPVRSAPAAQRTMTLEVWGLQSAAGARAVRPAQQATPAPVAASAPASAAPALPPVPQSPVSASPARAPEPSPVATAPSPPSGAAPSTVPPQPPVPQPARTGPSASIAPPGVTPPLPPPRGPNGRVALQQQVPPPAAPPPRPAAVVAPPEPPPAPVAATLPAPTPTPTPAPIPAVASAPPLPARIVPPAAIGDETRDGIFMGRKTLAAAAEDDVVPIGVQIGRFDKIRLRALEAGIRLAAVRIHYVSGAPDSLPVDVDISANSRTRWLPISGDRAIRDITLAYRRRDGGRGAATIEIYGEHAAGYLDPGGEGANLARYNGWVPMGARTTALRVGFDQVEFQIGGNKGGFKKLRVDAKERAITLREVRVVYGTGEDEIITIDTSRQKIAAGASFGPIDLRGSSRPVKQVILKTRSRFLDSEARARDAAIVEVWGLH